MIKYKVSIEYNGYRMYHDCEDMAEAYDCIKAIDPLLSQEEQSEAMVRLFELGTGEIRCASNRRWSAKVISK